MVSRKNTNREDIALSEIYVLERERAVLRSELLGREVSYFTLKILTDFQGVMTRDELSRSLFSVEESMISERIELLRETGAIEMLGYPERKFHITRDGRRWFGHLRALNVPSLGGYIELLTTGIEIWKRFLQDLSLRSGLLRKVYIVSPFLTETKYLEELTSVIAYEKQPDILYFVTRPSNDVYLDRDKHESFVSTLESRGVYRKLVKGLHAKIFLAQAYDPRESFAIVSSFNITPHPVIDFGAYVRGELEEMRDFLDSLEESIKRLEST